MNISIPKNSAEGKALTQAAEYIGIDPADLLAGICINATRRARTNANAAHTDTVATKNAPEARKPAPSAGLFNL